MDMKINSSLIVEHRNTRAWSQQHLAEVCDLSLRTIQRVENTGQASQETIKAIAAAFDLDVAMLLLGPPTPPNVSALSRIRKFAIASTAIVAMASTAFLMVPASTADEFVVTANTINVSRYNDETVYRGDVEISLSGENEMIVESKESWVDDGVSHFSGTVTIRFGKTVVYLGDAAVSNDGNVTRVLSDYARMTRSWGF